MNFKNLALKAITCLPIVSTIAFNTNVANAATRIAFARGSYCGSYSGDFSGGREFVLNLGRGQTFTSRNIGGGVQYDMYVYGPVGSIYGAKLSSSQINYQIPSQGDYHIYIESSTTYNSVEFCAY
ncbi:hypothetical protein NIES4102_44300 (plasmid) [Chondrocystis sp. NIES-4102]|nr:hypothetical protein NIES4102_44300 [Chondrocystis sp. NIES-4102]